MMEFNGEKFYHVAGAARFLGISRFMFYYNIKSKLTAYWHQGSRRAWYREVDLVPYRSVVQIAS